MPHLLGIDIGTSGTKTLICDEDGKVLATAMAEHPISLAQARLVASRTREDWWEATCKATKAVLKKAKLKAADVGGIGLSGPDARQRLPRRRRQAAPPGAALERPAHRRSSAPRSNRKPAGARR